MLNERLKILCPESAEIKSVEHDCVFVSFYRGDNKC